MHVGNCLIGSRLQLFVGEAQGDFKVQFYETHL